MTEEEYNEICEQAAKQAAYDNAYAFYSNKADQAESRDSNYQETRVGFTASVVKGK